MPKLTENLLKKALEDYHGLAKHAAVLKTVPVEIQRGLHKTVGVKLTLERASQQYDAASDSFGKGGLGAGRNDLLQTLRKKFEELNQCLKANLALYERVMYSTISSDIEEVQDVYKAAEILVHRLDAVRKTAKLDLEQRERAANEDQSEQAKLAGNIKVFYLGMKKGIAEANGSVNLFLAKPTKDNFLAFASSNSGIRSIAVGVTGLKKYLPQDAITARAKALVDQHLDMTQNKGATYWEPKLKMDQQGWEQRATASAKTILQWLRQCGEVAEELKKRHQEMA